MRVQRLEHCISDLTAILELSARWAGREPIFILDTLLDALARMLNVDFIYVHFGSALLGSPIELTRIPRATAHSEAVDQLAAILRALLQENPASTPFVRHPGATGTCRIAMVRFGDDSSSVLIAGAQRDMFPDEMEGLLVRVAVNQAAISLQEELRVAEQKSAAGALESRVATRTAQLKSANDELALELGSMMKLHRFSTQLMATAELEAVLEEILSATIELQGADFGLVQLYDAEARGLVIATQRNMRREFLEHFSLVSDETSACGRALRTAHPVVIEDVEMDPQFAPHREVAARAGFRAVQSTPLVSRAGVVLGVVSTHFQRPHRPSEQELRLTDLYGRQAAEIVERKQAEEERDKLAALVENTADFIGIATQTGKVVFVNGAGRRLVGLDQHEAVPETIPSYLAEEEHERFEREIMPRLEAEGRWDGELCLRNFKTGAEIPVLVHTFFVLDKQSGRRLALATMCRDIRERKRAEQRFSSAQDELARVTRMLTMGELTTSIAHEVNQPLAAIIANGNACLRWLARETPDILEARASAEHIIRDANHAGAVIQRIRASSTKLTPPRALLDLNEGIREILTLISNEAARNRVVLRVHLTDPLPRVFCDRVQLQQVMLNLVMNGIDAMLDVSNRARELEIASVMHGPQGVEVAVRDCGVGIGADNLERLFEPFFTTKAQGMGLGLSISRRIIEAHGGRLWATSNPKHGLTMTFALPTDGGEPLCQRNP
jgi:PAS domain S-box-containing protein